MSSVAPVPRPGWDSEATIVDGLWLDRVPRRPEVLVTMQAEVRLLAAIADRLPLPVPRPVLRQAPTRLRHPLIVGDACDPASLTADQGRALGEFLGTLHHLSEKVWQDSGIPVGADAHDWLVNILARMEHDVVPLLPREQRAPGRSLLARLRQPPPDPTLVHADLGPDHLLLRDGRIAGVIDWLDAREGDPAVDLSWALHGTARPFAEALAAAYGVSDEVCARAHDWHCLGPWYEVLWGLDGHGADGGAQHVREGLAGASDRLAGDR